MTLRFEAPFAVLYNEADPFAVSVRSIQGGEVRRVPVDVTDQYLLDIPGHDPEGWHPRIQQVSGMPTAEGVLMVYVSELEDSPERYMFVYRVSIPDGVTTKVLAADINEADGAVRPYVTPGGVVYLPLPTPQGELLVSRDGGRTFIESITLPLQAIDLGNGVVATIPARVCAVCVVGERILIKSAHSVYGNFEEAFYQSLDGGSTWANVTGAVWGSFLSGDFEMFVVGNDICVHRSGWLEGETVEEFVVLHPNGGTTTAPARYANYLNAVLNRSTTVLAAITVPFDTSPQPWWFEQPEDWPAELVWPGTPWRDRDFDLIWPEDDEWPLDQFNWYGYPNFWPPMIPGQEPEYSPLSWWDSKPASWPEELLWPQGAPMFEWWDSALITPFDMAWPRSEYDWPGFPVWPPIDPGSVSVPGAEASGYVANPDGSLAEYELPGRLLCVTGGTPHYWTQHVNSYEVP